VSTPRAFLLPRHPELVSGSIVKSALPYRRQTQPNRKINPMRVFSIDKVYFPRPMPILKLFLTSNGSLHRAEKFKMHQPVNRIIGRMARRQMATMLRKPLQQVRGYADVKRAIKLARKDIHARLLFQSHRQSIAEKWTPKQVQGDGMECLV
jgi:hypothetical protein